MCISKVVHILTLGSVRIVKQTFSLFIRNDHHFSVLEVIFTGALTSSATVSTPELFEVSMNSSHDVEVLRLFLRSRLLFVAQRCGRRTV